MKFKSYSDEDKEKIKIRNKILSLLGLVVVLLVGSSIVYSNLEGWNFIDSLYFSTITMTTIGYGDLHPTTNASKLFTIFFALSGVSMMLYALSTLGMHYIHYLDTQKPTIRKNITDTVKKFTSREDDNKWVNIHRLRK